MGHATKKPRKQPILLAFSFLFLQSMTRKKVKLAYITNESNRKATFKKRKKGLIKKASELSTLCDVKACAIIYSPYESVPEVWPCPVGARRVLEDFKKLSELEQSKKMMNQESFLQQRIAKASDHLKKQRKDNREKEMVQVMYQTLVGDRSLLQSLNMADLGDLGWLLDRNLKEICKKAADQRRPAAAAPVVGPPAEMRQKWFVDFVSQPEQMVFGGGGEEMVLPPFVEAKYNNMWSNAFFSLKNEMYLKF